LNPYKIEVHTSICVVINNKLETQDENCYIELQTIQMGSDVSYNDGFISRNV